MSREHGEMHDHDHDHEAAEPEVKHTTWRGKTYFRSLEEVEHTEEFKAFLGKEFPAGAKELADPVSRRDFLTLMGASMGLAGFGSGCLRRPEAHILPYVKRPEEVIPGLPVFYATTLSYSGNVTGLVVEAHEGRPTKIEGNALHPASEGGACAIEQAGILGVYDPDRVTTIWQGDAPGTQAGFDAFLNQRLAELKNRGGQGLFVLHQQYSSPAFQAQVAALREAMPQAQVLEYEPFSDADVRGGTRIAFGEPLLPIYRADAAVVLCVDDDLLGEGPFHLRYARDWARRHDPELATTEKPMGRLWVAEPVMTVTGASADHRLRIRATEVGPFLRVLAARLQAERVELPAGIAAAGDGGFDPKFMAVLAKDLASNRRKSLVTVGRHQPAEVQALAHAINAALGNVGQTVAYGRPVDPERAPHVDAIRTLAAALDAGQVDTLVVMGANPAFDGPADLDLAGKLKKARYLVHHSLYRDETGVLAGWVVPQAHWLESWGDAVASDGTYSLQQPLIDPIWGGTSPVEMMARLAGVARPVGRDLVRQVFLPQHGGESGWQRALHDGIVPDTAGRFVVPELDAAAVGTAAARVPEASPPATLEGMELLLLTDGKVWDGRFANNGWLQELPHPITKLSWSNAALLSQGTARALNVRSRDMVKVEIEGRSLELPVWVQPGMADNVVAIALGYGRRVAGRVGDGRGFDAYALRTSAGQHVQRGARVAASGGTFPLATMQDHDSMEGRPLVRVATMAEYKEEPFFAREMVEHPPLVALWKQHEYPGQQWGMTIDLSRCVGCNGCMIACQAENNIPIVGPEQIRNGREMYWIRLDRYYASTGDDPTDLSDVEVLHQPVTCMQCENAPCENVCPVAATVHSPDGGLNDMVYNRCVGTRYCSNNCPYKVRRFNYFDWHQQGVGQRDQPLTLVEKMKFNPDVTVRARGVMEKCTYCVQRIHAARRSAKLAGREKIADGAVVPACAQACPTEAIAFGDVTDPGSQVSLLKKRARNYELLAELNTKPRTSYLAKISNPHPEMKA